MAAIADVTNKDMGRAFVARQGVGGQPDLSVQRLLGRHGVLEVIA